MQYFCFIILLVFAIFGFSEFLHILKLFIVFPKAKINSCLVVKLKNATAEKQMLHTCEQFCWYGKRFADSITFKYEGLDEPIFERCQKIAQRYGMKI